MNVHKSKMSTNAHKLSDKVPKRDIYERIYRFVLDCLSVVRTFPRNLESSVVSKQIIRSATSIGANSQEADGSESKAEFIHRFSIAKKEAKETDYWLRIVSDINNIDVKDLRDELRQIILIISTIIIKVRGKK